MKNLIYSGGIYHDFAQMAEALKDELALDGIQSTISFDLDECARQLESGDVDLLTVYALRWRMLEGEKYAPLRQEWALEVSDAARMAIERHVARGGGLLVLHTGVICFDDWPQWPQILGGGWVWGTSSHPPLQAAAVRVLDASNPLTIGISKFDLQDEVYQDLRLEEDIEVLATATAGSDGVTQQHPVIWMRRYGLGRVFCDTLGHDAESIGESNHAELLRRGARWAATGH